MVSWLTCIAAASGVHHLYTSMATAVTDWRLAATLWRSAHKTQAKLNHIHPCMTKFLVTVNVRLEQDSASQVQVLLQTLAGLAAASYALSLSLTVKRSES